MASVEIARAAVEDLDRLIAALILPVDTRNRVRSIQDARSSAVSWSKAPSK